MGLCSSAQAVKNPKNKNGNPQNCPIREELPEREPMEIIPEPDPVLLDSSIENDEIFQHIRKQDEFIVRGIKGADDQRKNYPFPEDLNFVLEHAYGYSTYANIIQNCFYNSLGEIVYPLGCIGVVLNTEFNTQKFFGGKTPTDNSPQHNNMISSIAISQSRNIIATGQVFNSESKISSVMLWGSSNCNLMAQIEIKSKGSRVSDLSFSMDDKLLSILDYGENTIEDTKEKAEKSTTIHMAHISQINIGDISKPVKVSTYTPTLDSGIYIKHIINQRIRDEEYKYIVIMRGRSLGILTYKNGSFPMNCLMRIKCPGGGIAKCGVSMEGNVYIGDNKGYIHKYESENLELPSHSVQTYKDTDIDTENIEDILHTTPCVETMYISKSLNTLFSCSHLGELIISSSPDDLRILRTLVLDVSSPVSLDVWSNIGDVSNSKLLVGRADGSVMEYSAIGDNWNGTPFVSGFSGDIANIYIYGSEFIVTTEDGYIYQYNYLERGREGVGVVDVNDESKGCGVCVYGGLATNYIHQIDISPAGEVCLVLSDCKVQIRRHLFAEKYTYFDVLPGYSYFLPAFSPNGKLLAVGTMEGGIAVFNCENNYSPDWKGGLFVAGGVVSIDWNYESTFLRVMVEDYTIIYIDVLSHQILKEDLDKEYMWVTNNCILGNHIQNSKYVTEDGKNDVNSIDISPNKQIIAIGDKKGMLLLNKNTPQEQLSPIPIRAHGTEITQVKFSDDNEYLFTMSQKERIILQWKRIQTLLQLFLHNSIL